MRYNSITIEDIANGDGVGVSLYIQGCPHHCPGCFNALINKSPFSFYFSVLVQTIPLSLFLQARYSSKIFAVRFCSEHTSVQEQFRV